MTVGELRNLLKGLPGKMEVMSCDIDGAYSKTGIHEYDHVISEAKYKKVKMKGYVSDGHGGHDCIYGPTIVKVKDEQTEKRKGLFIDLPCYNH